MKYKKKPVVIEAVQFTGKNGQEIANFMDCQFPALCDGNLIIGTLEGCYEASPGDWIIKGVKGEFYPCKPDIFEATYEPAVVGRDEPRAKCIHGAWIDEQNCTECKAMMSELLHREPKNPRKG